MPIIAVTFDLWQTLLLDRPELGRARTNARIAGTLKALNQAGEEFSEDRVILAYERCYRTCHEIHIEERDVSFMEQVDIFIRRIDEGLVGRLEQEVVEQIATSYADAFFCQPPAPHPEAIGVLQRARDEGYTLGLISNTGMTPGVTFRAYMEQVGILEYFHALTFSDEVRLSKPSTEIFLQTLHGLDVSPEQTIHVGDHLLNDVFGARRAGMKTIWIETHDESRPNVDVEPDATVASLEQVNHAIETIAQAHA